MFAIGWIYRVLLKLRKIKRIEVLSPGPQRMLAKFRVLGKLFFICKILESVRDELLPRKLTKNFY